MNQQDKFYILTRFIERMKKIGITIECIGNYPWIYIDTINGKRVTEKFHGEHGFTICFLPVRVNQEMEFTDIKEIFKLIRKYAKPTNSVDQSSTKINLQ